MRKHSKSRDGAHGNAGRGACRPRWLHESGQQARGEDPHPQGCPRANPSRRHLRQRKQTPPSPTLLSRAPIWVLAEPCLPPTPATARTHGPRSNGGVCPRTAGSSSFRNERRAGGRKALPRLGVGRPESRAERPRVQQVAPGAVTGLNSVGNTVYPICPPKGRPKPTSLPYTPCQKRLSPRPGFDPAGLRREAQAISRKAGFRRSAMELPKRVAVCSVELD
jgi:hypothetical protein